MNPCDSSRIHLSNMSDRSCDRFHMSLIIYSAFVIILSRADFVQSDCDVVTRDQWDGLSPVHVEYLPRPVGLVIVQHTATPSCATDDACAETIRSIQDYNMDQLKFWDIGYNFLVGGNGKVYEGPGWLRVGAHTFGYNRMSVAISFIGNFNNERPTPAALEAAKALIRCGVDKGHLKSDYKLVGHKQLIATESPGRKLYNEIRRWPNWLEDSSSIKI